MSLHVSIPSFMYVLRKAIQFYRKPKYGVFMFSSYHGGCKEISFLAIICLRLVGLHGSSIFLHPLPLLLRLANSVHGGS